MHFHTSVKEENVHIIDEFIRENCNISIRKISDLVGIRVFIGFFIRIETVSY